MKLLEKSPNARQLSVSNGTAQYPSVSVTTSVGGSESGNLFVPPATENYTYDTDGNLLSDGRWSYSWDQENRLVQMVKQVPTVDTSKYTNPADGLEYAFEKLRFDYDHMGRRIAKKYYTNSGDSTPALTLVFLYDGWNLIAELNGSASNARVRTYVWGSDLSGTLEGAGGIGGLVMVMDYTNGGRHHYPAYDGNGNLAGLVDGTDGTWSARYEYGAFGEPLRGSGPMAEESPFRFSTKYIDNESGMAYYGYRYYNPQTGRWLNRDPIGERGSLNIYLFNLNNAINLIDPLGRAPKLQPGTTLKQPGEDGPVEAKVLRSFTQKDRDLAYKGLCMLRLLIGDVLLPYFPDFYIGNH